MQKAGKPWLADPGVCPVCAARDIRMLFVKQDIPYYRCIACTFVFSRPAQNANLKNEIDDFEPAYLEYLREGLEDRVNYESLLQWISRVCILAGARWLDVGTGTGKFVKYLRTRSIEAYGLEPSRALFHHFLQDESYFANQDIEGFLSNGQNGQFDVVTALDVIEHVQEPDRFIASLAMLLRPGGYWVVSTPDVSSLFARLTGRRWHHYNKYHLSYFSPQTLSRLAVKHGLRVAAVAHRGRLRSAGYMFRYFADFVMGGKHLNAPPTFLEGCVVPINLMDTMYLCLRMV